MRNSIPTTMVLTLLLYLVYLPAFASGNKVDICHLPPGNPDNWHTITISVNALPAHLNHGDHEGSCLANCETLCSDDDVCTQDVESNANECMCLSEPTAVNCDDSNECTADSCNSANDEGCVNDPLPMNGTSCDNGNGVCASGVCEELAPVEIGQWQSTFQETYYLTLYNDNSGTHTGMTGVFVWEGEPANRAITEGHESLCDASMGTAQNGTWIEATIIEVNQTEVQLMCAEELVPGTGVTVDHFHTYRLETVNPI